VSAGRVLAALVALALLVAAALGGLYTLVTRELERPLALARPVVVHLPRGAGVAEITRRLVEAGVVRRPWLFRLHLALSGRDRRLRAGEYRFEPGMTLAAAVDRMVRGQVLLHRITVPEGLTVREVYARLRANDLLAGDLPPLPEEGSLLPDTWLVPRDYPRRLLVARMQQAMREALAEAWAARRPDLPLKSPRELLILASIVEKETSRPEEYARVAAVYVNRLRRGMKLQADPTVVYALTRGEGRLGRPLTRADLRVDDPYNTYRHAGLPPGPIANPGRAVLMATARPAEVDDLYFVADGTGGHRFAATFAEHRRNVRHWRRLRRFASGRIPPVPRPRPTVSAAAETRMPPPPRPRPAAAAVAGNPDGERP